MRQIGWRRFPAIYAETKSQLLYQQPVKMNSWQSTDVSKVDQFDTYELRNHIFEIEVPDNVGDLVLEVMPDIPWAEDHFQERVSGEPLNPPPSEKDWPHHKGHRAEMLAEADDEGEKYSHTYPERLWPKHAGDDYQADKSLIPRLGVRYEYGDLRDVVDLLGEDPTTRQAFVPIWFPEDTGVVHGERVPCTLGYHFLIRQGKLHCTYMIRSVDFVRHFRNDVYMAARLMQWVCDELNHEFGDDAQIGHLSPEGYLVEPGTLTMHTMSMHLFVGDRHRVENK